MSSPAPIAFEAIQPGRLWSLWDMYEMKLGPLMAAFNHVATFSQTMILAKDRGQSNVRHARRSWEELRTNVTTLKEIGEAADLPMIADYAETMLTEMTKCQVWMNDWVTLDAQGAVLIGGAATRLQESVPASTTPCTAL